MATKSINIKLDDVLYCMKALNDYRPELCKDCKLYGSCDYALRGDLFELAIHTIEEYQKIHNNIGNFSDGYHTFNQLYHQRAMLFAAIVNQNPDIAWKSFKHADGNYCFDSNGEWFIVGVDTPEGSYTYHYEKKYWDIFKCEELECGKPWDGHTEEDVTRLLSLERHKAIGKWNGDPNSTSHIYCTNCNKSIDYTTIDFELRYCPNCGAYMAGGAIDE